MDPMFTNRHLLKATELGFGIAFDDSVLSLDDTCIPLGKKIVFTALRFES